MTGSEVPWGALSLCQRHEASVGGGGFNWSPSWVRPAASGFPLSSPPRVAVHSARFTPLKHQIFLSAFGSLSQFHLGTGTKVSSSRVPVRRVGTPHMSDNGCRDVIALEPTFRDPLKVQEELRTP